MSAKSASSSDTLTINIKLNGDPYTIDGDPHLIALIEKLGMKRGRIAVELNHEIVPKSEYDQIVLKPGDNLEVINFVGGG
jgi:sulfur carrier protein